MKIVLLTLLLVAAAYAQLASASLDGTVTDQSNAVVAGAAITASQPATGFVRTAVTDARGNYVFEQLAPGTYTVTTAKTGFRDYEATGITLEVNRRVRHEIR